MDKAVDALFQFHEGTELRQVAHQALLDGTHLVLILDLIPGIGLQLLDTQGNFSLRDVDIKDLGLKGLTQGEYLRRVADVLDPRHLGDMNQALYSLLDFHEGPVVGHAYHPALNHRTDRVLGLHAFPGMWLELLESQ
ncbi:hypothetical protein ES703_122244 [subsurface metagenome]